MLASTCSIRLATLATVKFLSRLLTALKRLPSSATTARVNRLNWRHRTTNCAQGRADRCAIVTAEIRDRLEVRHQAPGQPHQFDVALRLALQPAARLDPVQIAVEIDLQERCWMIGGPAGQLRDHPLKPQLPQIQLVDQDVNHPHRIVLADIIVKILREQNTLSPILTLDKALHQKPRLNPSGFYLSQRFHTASTQSGRSMCAYRYTCALSARTFR